MQLSRPLAQLLPRSKKPAQSPVARAARPRHHPRPLPTRMKRAGQRQQATTKQPKPVSDEDVVNDIYSTPLDKSTISREQRLEAERIAQEIEEGEGYQRKGARGKDNGSKGKGYERRDDGYKGKGDYGKDDRKGKGKHDGSKGDRDGKGDRDKGKGDRDKGKGDYGKDDRKGKGKHDDGKGKDDGKASTMTERG